LKVFLDVAALVLFAGLAILYLQRSISDRPDAVAIWKYAAAGVGCAVGDVLGNHNQPLAAILVFAAVVLFSLAMLDPFNRGPPA
jgi:hypothetical protein